MRRLLPLALALNWLVATLSGGAFDAAAAIPKNCGQLVLVTSADWTSSRGKLRRFERADAVAAWRVIGEPCEVLLGERGLAWGHGLHEVPPATAPTKREGDRRAPAGVFSLTSAFGREPLRLRLPYRRLQAGDEAVDDPASRFYNQIVQHGAVAQPDWRSSERMFEIPDYSLGIVVAHNPANRPGVGSCIFIHEWRGTRTGTAGCTVLRAADLRVLVDWLDARQRPVLVQLPRSELLPGWP